MEDKNPYPYPVALHWDLGPEKLKQMKNKLSIYFGSPKKSNGGECVMEDLDCTKGHVLIHFNKKTVRDQVLGKQEHVLTLPDEQELKLDVRPLESKNKPSKTSPKEQESPAESTAKKRLHYPGTKDESEDTREPQHKRSHLQDTSHAQPGSEVTSAGAGTPEPPSSLVLIENVQDPCTLDMLNLLLENITEKKTQDFQVQMVPEICAAVVTFTSNIDLLGFLRDFGSSLRANTMKLTAKPLEETSAIRVEGLPPNTSEDHIILYFESSNHGGGKVQETELLPEQNAATIKFHGKGVARTVLGMKHVFGKTEISVYPYYVSLGIALYGKNRPHVTKPEPLEIPVSPYILEFILNDAQGKLHIEEKMASLHCDITWPELTRPNLAIRLCVSSKVSAHVRTLVKIAPTWRDKVSAECKQLITKYKVAEFPGSVAVWEAIKQDIGSSAYSRVLVKPNLAKMKIFLAGLMADVTQTEPVLRKLIEDTRQKIHRQTQSTTDELDLAPALYEIMSRNGLEQNMKQSLPGLKMSYDGSRMKLLLSGLREEIYGSKCKIMEMERNLKHASISLDPHIVRFLKATSSDAMSSALFIRRNINAVFEVVGDIIKLSGFYAWDVFEAEKIIRREMVCKKVTVEDKSLIKSAEWQSLLRSFQGFNAQQPKFLMEECPRGTEDQVVISGLSSAVQEVYESVHEFIGENTPMKKEIIVQSMAVARFLGDEKKPLWGDIGQMNVKSTINQRTITLNGPKPRVVKAAACIEKVLSSLCTDTLRIDKPGAKTFCKDNEFMYITAMNKFDCALYLVQDGEKDFAESQCQITLTGGVTVAVYKGDLIQHRADAVVIAVNENLTPMGPLGLALLRAAGPKLQTDCDRIIKEKSRMLLGDSVITNAGNLPYKHVILTVTPLWNFTSQCKQLIQKAITLSLELAAENGHRSIAIPAITSVPLDKCVEISMKSIHDYVGQHSTGSIDRIHFVDINDHAINIFIQALKKEPLRQEQSSGGTSQGSDTNRPRGNAVKTKGQRVTTNEGLIIKLIQGNIQDTATDVIVNSVGKDLILSSGGASKVLFEKAGKGMQVELDKLRPVNQVVDGSVFVTSGGQLSCMEVYHAVAPQWDGQMNTSEKTLKQIVSVCLNTAVTRQMNSIAFPAIGTGILRFPKAKVAAIMFDEILSFSSTIKLQSLKEVHLVLHPSDAESIKEFSSELTKRTDTSAPAASGTGAASVGAVTSPAPGVHEMMIRSVLCQVKVGDITKEDTDVIVNSSNHTFNQYAGVSKAILDAAGPAVVQECAQLASQPNKSFILTQNGNLRCKRILHVHIAKTAADVKGAVCDVLQECEAQKFTSVAFPALGTGAACLPAAAAADAMLDALLEFASSSSVRHVQKVKVVVFQQTMINDFSSSMTKKAASGQTKNTSFFSKITAFFWKPITSSKEKPPQRFLELKDNTEPVIFHLCGESQKSVKEASTWLQNLIIKEQSENSIKNDWIKDFGEQEIEVLRGLQKGSNVTISLAIHESKVTVSGLTRDVLSMTNKIQTLIDNLRDQKTREREAELCSNVVEWRYNDGLESRPVDMMTNLELENAKTENKGSITISIKGMKYTVNMEGKSASNSKGKSVKLERVPKSEQSSDLPTHWDSMDNHTVKMVLLSPGSKEYDNVKQQFVRTCQMRIIKIERIQNSHLWLNYKIKKQSIDCRNGNTNNEKQLFHGTDPKTISHVNHNGFNRSYAGKNAASYGNGTYFAVNAMYSAHDTYSRPDSNGYKYMYLTRVTTGVYCVGTHGMVVPPAKNPSNPTDLYDSVTDNMAQPSMFVIFNDVQAYPEYLITFSK